MIGRSLPALRPAGVTGSWRSARLDAVVIGGWLLLAVVGQWVLREESPSLELLAAAWLWLGMTLVRPVWSLPLLLLTSPVFMCESHRAWSWVQPAAAAVLLFRVVVGSRFTAGQAAAIVGVAGATLLASWPADASQLLAEYTTYPTRQMLEQWLRPEATWAVFPFRSAVDRALMAALVAALTVNGRYVSARRVWTAFWLSALMMLLGAYGPVLVPGHIPHRYLGTSNAGLYMTSLFHGAGYNLHFLVVGIAVGVAYFFLPLRTPDHPVRLASAILLLPLLLVRQRALVLSLVALAALALVLMVVSARSRRPGSRAARPFRHLQRGGRTMGAVSAVLATAVVAAWGWKLGIGDPDSELRAQLRARPGSLLSMKSQPPAASPPPAAVPPATAMPGAGPGTPDAAPRPPQTLIRRLADRLIALDDARGAMWILGGRTILREHLWRGAGAGTWARFHRAQPRPTRLSYANMHNTYLDLAYEYGLVPIALLSTLAMVALYRLATSGRGSTAWLFSITGLAMAATGQHLFYSFGSAVATIPVMLALARALVRPPGRDKGLSSAGHS